MSGMSGMSGMGGKSSNPHDEFRVDLAKRRFKSYMHSVLIGLEGQKQKVVTKPIATDENSDDQPGDADTTTVSNPSGVTMGVLSLAKTDSDRDYIRRVAEKITEIRDMMDDHKRHDLQKLIADVESKNRELESIYGVAKKAAPKVVDEGLDADAPDAQ